MSYSDAQSLPAELLLVGAPFDLYIKGPRKSLLIIPLMTRTTDAQLLTKLWTTVPAKYVVTIAPQHRRLQLTHAEIKFIACELREILVTTYVRHCSSETEAAAAASVEVAQLLQSLVDAHLNALALQITSSSIAAPSNATSVTTTAAHTIANTDAAAANSIATAAGNSAVAVEETSIVSPSRFQRVLLGTFNELPQLLEADEEEATAAAASVAAAENAVAATAGAGSSASSFKAAVYESQTRKRAVSAVTATTLSAAAADEQEEDSKSIESISGCESVAAPAHKKARQSETSETFTAAAAFTLTAAVADAVAAVTAVAVGDDSAIDGSSSNRNKTLQQRRVKKRGRNNAATAATAALDDSDAVARPQQKKQRFDDAAAAVATAVDLSTAEVLSQLGNPLPLEPSLLIAFNWEVIPALLNKYLPLLQHLTAQSHNNNSFSNNNNNDNSSSSSSYSSYIVSNGVIDLTAAGDVNSNGRLFYSLHADGKLRLSQQQIEFLRSKSFRANVVSVNATTLLDPRWRIARSGPQQQQQQQQQVYSLSMRPAAAVDFSPWCSGYAVQQLMISLLSLHSRNFLPLHQQQHQQQQQRQVISTIGNTAAVAAAFSKAAAGGSLSNSPLIQQALRERELALNARESSLSQLQQVILHHQDLLPKEILLQTILQFTRGSGRFLTANRNSTMREIHNSKIGEMNRFHWKYSNRALKTTSYSSSTIVAATASTTANVATAVIGKIIAAKTAGSTVKRNNNNNNNNDDAMQVLDSAFTVKQERRHFEETLLVKPVAQLALDRTCKLLGTWDHSIRPGNFFATAEESTLLCRSSMQCYRLALLIGGSAKCSQRRLFPFTEPFSTGFIQLDRRRSKAISAATKVATTAATASATDEIATLSAATSAINEAASAVAVSTSAATESSSQPMMLQQKPPQQMKASKAAAATAEEDADSVASSEDNNNNIDDNSHSSNNSNKKKSGVKADRIGIYCVLLQRRNFPHAQFPRLAGSSSARPLRLVDNFRHRRVYPFVGDQQLSTYRRIDALFGAHPIVRCSSSSSSSSSSKRNQTAEETTAATAAAATASKIDSELGDAFDLIADEDAVAAVTAALITADAEAATADNSVDDMQLIADADVLDTSIVSRSATANITYSTTSSAPTVDEEAATAAALATACFIDRPAATAFATTDETAHTDATANAATVDSNNNNSNNNNNNNNNSSSSSSNRLLFLQQESPHLSAHEAELPALELMEFLKIIASLKLQKAADKMKRQQSLLLPQVTKRAFEISVPQHNLEKRQQHQQQEQQLQQLKQHQQQHSVDGRRLLLWRMFDSSALVAMAVILEELVAEMMQQWYSRGAMLQLSKKSLRTAALAQLNQAAVGDAQSLLQSRLESLFATNLNAYQAQLQTLVNFSAHQQSSAADEFLPARDSSKRSNVESTMINASVVDMCELFTAIDALRGADCCHCGDCVAAAAVEQQQSRSHKQRLAQFLKVERLQRKKSFTTAAAAPVASVESELNDAISHSSNDRNNCNSNNNDSNNISNINDNIRSNSANNNNDDDDIDSIKNAIDNDNNGNNNLSHSSSSSNSISSYWKCEFNDTSRTNISKVGSEENDSSDSDNDS